MPLANDMFLSGRGLRCRPGHDRAQRSARDQQPAMLCIDPADQRQIDQNLAELLATPV
jgi:hypothetical protein